MIDQPGLAVGGAIVVGGVRGHPLKSIPTIMICRRERVLRGEPVLHRNHYDINLGHEGVEVVVVELGEGGFKEEATAMEVDQDGEFVVVSGLGDAFWKVKTSRDGGVVLDYYVFG